MKHNILYCSTSWHSSAEANSIQVSEMIKAFENAGCCVTSIYKSQSTSKSDQRKIQIKTKRNRLSHYMYLIKAALKSIQHVKTKNIDLLYTRSISIAFLVNLFSSVKINIEMHGVFANRLEKSLLQNIKKERIIVICITKEIIKYLKKNNIEVKTIHLPDAHSCDIKTIKNDSPYFNIWQKEYMPKVGYFGRVNKQKGKDFLYQIAEKSNEIRLYIYALNEINIHKSGCLVEYGNLSHNKATRKMNEMDILLLLIEPQNDPRDISPYTSPLKLFEYAATGKMIIASDTGSLRDVLTDQVYFIKNDIDEFRKCIKNIKCNTKDRKYKSRRLTELAFKYTWANRVNKILKINFQKCY